MEFARVRRGRQLDGESAGLPQEGTSLLSDCQLPARMGKVIAYGERLVAYRERVAAVAGREPAVPDRSGIQ